MKFFNRNVIVIVISVIHLWEFCNVINVHWHCSCHFWHQLLIWDINDLSFCASSSKDKQFTFEWKNSLKRLLYAYTYAYNSLHKILLPEKESQVEMNAALSMTLFIFVHNAIQTKEKSFALFWCVCVCSLLQTMQTQQKETKLFFWHCVWN